MANMDYGQDRVRQAGYGYAVRTIAVASRGLPICVFRLIYKSSEKRYEKDHQQIQVLFLYMRICSRSGLRIRQNHSLMKGGRTELPIHIDSPFD
jgi:hypothetical protein